MTLLGRKRVGDVSSRLQRPPDRPVCIPAGHDGFPESGRESQNTLPHGAVQAGRSRSTKRTKPTSTIGANPGEPLLKATHWPTGVNRGGHDHLGKRVLSARGAIRDMGYNQACCASRAQTHFFALVGHYCSRLVSLAFVLDQLEQLAPLNPCAPSLFAQSRALEACPRERGTGKNQHTLRGRTDMRLREALVYDFQMPATLEAGGCRYVNDCASGAGANRVAR
jgi:hypothetical protein